MMRSGVVLVKKYRGTMNQSAIRVFLLARRLSRCADFASSIALILCTVDVEPARYETRQRPVLEGAVQGKNVHTGRIGPFFRGVGTILGIENLSGLPGANSP